MLSDVLLVIDLQNGVCKNGKIYNYKNIIQNINNEIDKFHLNKKPVIFIQHNDSSLKHGSNEWKLVSDLHNSDDDYYIEKVHADSFYKTELKNLLTKLNIRKIKICGAQTEYCVDTTIKVAHDLGYKITMLHQTTTTFDNDYLKAGEIINFYEKIWDKRFLTFKN